MKLPALFKGRKAKGEDDGFEDEEDSGAAAWAAGLEAKGIALAPLSAAVAASQARR